ncbi:hypothetical protein F4813DRAFT_369618 [Daldinia decipiens]|uniref:uncharacterized protein n=1 Tax=Daldinia decipiens TaxID=326647 RepID=UPI0020C24E76|nr:uncharacterized protein F4813DRAFT_369618 [Daldinia decipiens]KAI1654852.1 hypothetical protein F4813DRAFT_369618 [Daldinia decipiens]
MRVENEARKHRQASRTAQMLFDALCENRADLKCEFKCHKETNEAFEENLKAIADAMQKEAGRDQEVSALREELRMVNDSVSDQRNLSRIVSQKMEGLERLVRVQHNEIKQHKSEIEALKQANKILAEENDSLRVDSSSIQKISVGTQTGHFLDITSSDVVRRLEEQIVMSKKQTQKLLARVHQGSGQQGILENSCSSELRQATSQTIHEYQRNEHTANADQKLAARVAQLDINDRRTSDDPNVEHQYLECVEPGSMAAQHKPVDDVQIREVSESREIQETETVQDTQREERMAQFMMNISRGRSRVPRLSTSPCPSSTGEDVQGAASGVEDARGGDNGEHVMRAIVPLDDPIYDVVANENDNDNSID